MNSGTELKCVFCDNAAGDDAVTDDNGAVACKLCGETELATQEMEARIASLTVENAALRAALQEIADEEDTFNYGYKLPGIAQSALRGGK